MSDLARYLAGDNYLTRSASGIKRGLSALADSLAARSNEGIENMGAALSGVRVMPGAILTDAGYVMPDASGQPDFTQTGLEREPDVLRMLELFGGAMTPVKGAAIAAKAGTGGKVAADVAHALPMDKDSRMWRAMEGGYNIDRPLYHLTKSDIEAFRLNADPSSHTGGGAIWLRPNPRSHVSTHQTGGTGTDIYAEGANDIPLYSRLNSEVPYDIYSKMKDEGKLNPSFPFRVTTDENKLLSGMGYDHIVVPGEQMGEVVALDPSKLRSKFAAFDPAKADSADLLASRANLGPIVNALLQGYSER
jgi:hypothetical protein